MNSNRLTEGAYDVVAYSGEIDFDHSAAMRNEIIESLDRGQHVLVDLSEVTYIDSSIIAGLVQGLQHARSRDLKIDLIGVKGSVLKVLKLTRMDEVFTFYESVAAATTAE